MKTKTMQLCAKCADDFRAAGFLVSIVDRDGKMGKCAQCGKKHYVLEYEVGK